MFELCGKDTSRVRHAGDDISLTLNKIKKLPTEHHWTLAEKQNLGIQDRGEVHLLKQDFYFVVISVTIEVKKKINFLLHFC